MKFIKAPAQVIAVSFKKFYTDDCIILSASVSFAFLLSLIPFSALNIFLLSTIQNVFDPQSVMFNNIKGVLTDEIIVLIPFISKEWVQNNIVNTHAGYTSFTIINLALLPVVSSLVFKTLETSYHRIFLLKARFLVLRHLFYASRGSVCSTVR